MCTVKAIIGLFQDRVQQARFLKRCIGVGERGWGYEADTRHGTNLSAMHALDKSSSKGVATPGAKEVADFPEADEKLEKPGEEHDASRTGAGCCSTVPGVERICSTVQK